MKCPIICPPERYRPAIGGYSAVCSVEIILSTFTCSLLFQLSFYNRCAWDLQPRIDLGLILICGDNVLIYPRAENVFGTRAWYLARSSWNLSPQPCISYDLSSTSQSSCSRGIRVRSREIRWFRRPHSRRRTCVIFLLNRLITAALPLCTLSIPSLRLRSFPHRSADLSCTHNI